MCTITPCSFISEQVSKSRDITIIKKAAATSVAAAFFMNPGRHFISGGFLPQILQSFLLKAGISSGLPLVTRPRSTTISWSTQFTPAFFRAVLMEGNSSLVLQN
jgi:hypothetical protein